MTTHQNSVAPGSSPDNAPLTREGDPGEPKSTLLTDPRHVRSDSRMVIAAIKQGRLPPDKIRLLASRAAKIAADTESIRIFCSCVELLTAAAERLEMLATGDPVG